jgi:hypothetical protein
MGYLEFNPNGFSQGLGVYGATGRGLTINQTGQSTFGNTVFFANVGFSANGTLGTSGQVLTSNGSSSYWANATGGAYYKGNLGTVGATADRGNLYRINSNNQTASITIAAGENALTCGPITIDAGQTLTIETGGRAVII